MKDDKGKVIFSLLAGATAGIVTGLLLAPETGDDTRASLRRSARKLGRDVGEQARRTWARVTGTAPADAATQEAKTAADRLLAGMGTGQPRAHAGLDDSRIPLDSDYDGTGNDARHAANP